LSLLSRIRRYLSDNEVILGLLIFLISVFVVAESRWSRLENSRAVSSDEPVHLYLNQSAALPVLAQKLAELDLIQDQAKFKWAANIYGWNTFREGHYLIDQPFSYDTFLSKLARGIQDPVSVTILPGKSKGVIARSLSNNLQFDSTAIRQTLSDSTFLTKQEVDTEDVIGRLLPNTYSLYWTASPKVVCKRIFEEFHNAVVRKYRQRFNDLNRTVDEIITLASIIEWEAKSDKEKPTISGLYWNRLERGMRLQADPTVNFAVGERRRLLYKDYQIDHPYNTYQHAGLPPGPITNPSLSSIKAALFPEDHQYLYMVASPDGTHDFSKTFQEHKKKSEKWRRWLREQYRIKRQREQDSN